MAELGVRPTWPQTGCPVLSWFGLRCFLDCWHRGVGKGSGQVVTSFLCLKAAPPLLQETSSMCNSPLCRKCTGMCMCSPTTHRFGSEFQQPVSRDNILPLCGHSSILCRGQIHLVSILLSPSVTLKFL